jgi:hypothetical protein
MEKGPEYEVIKQIGTAKIEFLNHNIISKITLFFRNLYHGKGFKVYESGSDYSSEPTFHVSGFL